MTLSIINIGAMAFGMAVDLSKSQLQEKIFPLIGALGCGAWTYYLYKTYFDTYVAPVID